MIPLLHDFEGARVLIFGGGRVGARRARRFAREADVYVLAPAFADREFEDARRVRAAPSGAEVGEWVDRVDPALVVAATDDGDVNDAAAAAARNRGLLVNRADRAGGRSVESVAVPATVRDGPVVAAVGTSGRAPALSAHLRREVESLLDGTGALADLLYALRQETDGDFSAAARRAAFERVVADESVRDALADDDADRARAAARSVLEEYR